MFKRMLALVLALLMLTPSALAQEELSPVYLLMSADGQGGETPVGTAVLFADASTLLTTAWAVRSDGELYAVGNGSRLKVTRGTSAGGDLVLLTLEEPAPAAPVTLGEATSQLTLMGHLQDGAAASSGIEYASFMPYEDHYALLFTAQASLLPGSVLLDEYGSLSALTFAAYGEGVNRYAALTVDTLYTLLYAPEALPEGVSWLSGFSAAAGEGVITVDWSHCDVSCDRGDCVTGLFFSDSANPYFSYLDVTGDTAAELNVAPGRNYNVWIQHAHGELAITARRTAAQAVRVSLPQALPFDRFGYQDQEFYLSSAPADQAAAVQNTRVAPMPAVTAQALTDPDTVAFMQVTSAYAIEETSQCSLLVVLYTPEGYTFDYLGEFIFDVSLQEKDCWNVELTPMLQDYLSLNETGSMSPGEYTLCYYLDGCLGSAMTFTLE